MAKKTEFKETRQPKTKTVERESKYTAVSYARKTGIKNRKA